MLALILINLLNASITDNCVNEICNANVLVNGVVKYKISANDKTKVLNWINSNTSNNSWGRPEETKDICPTGFQPTDEFGNPVPIDDRTATSVVVVNLEYPIHDEDGNQTGTGNHDCDRYTFPADYTIELTNAQAEKDAQDYAAAGAAAKGLCDKIYHMVMGYNISRNFDTPTLNQMKVDFNNAKTYLQDCQVAAAKAEIEAISADPAKFTQEFKDMVLNEFTKAGF
jgi:hypothetical protein